MVAAAAVGAVGAVGGAYLASSSASNAAKTEAQSAANAQSQDLAIYNQNRQDTMPWLDQGKSALAQLGYLTGTSGNTAGDGVNTSMGGYGSLVKPFSQSDFVQDPGYQFTLAQGQKALNNSLSAKGGLLSGAAVKAGIDYNQGEANTEYNDVYNRYTQNQTDTYNRIAGLSGSGQQAASNLGTLGSNEASTQGALTTGAGNAIAAGQIASGNAWNTGLSSAGNSLSSIGTNNVLKQLLMSGGGGTTDTSNWNIG